MGLLLRQRAGIIATNAFMADMSVPPLVSSEAILAERLSTGLGAPVSPSAITTVPHHVAHVASAFEPSGFESALVVSYDGGGDDGHGKVVSVGDGEYAPSSGPRARRSRWASSITTRCGRSATAGSTSTR
jgi:predicted NodU family carbamoyl transferase